MGKKKNKKGNCKVLRDNVTNHKHETSKPFSAT